VIARAIFAALTVLASIAVLVMIHFGAPHDLVVAITYVGFGFSAVLIFLFFRDAYHDARG